MESLDNQTGKVNYVKKSNLSLKLPKYGINFKGGN